MDYHSYAKTNLDEQLRCLIKEQGPVRKGSDGEALHRMRVSTRRLRAALRVFKGILPADMALKWKKRMRKIGRVLGKGRELDILIRLFESLKEKIEDPAHITAVNHIIIILQGKRKNAQKRIVSVLDDKKTRKKLDDLQGYLKGLSGKGHAPAGQDSSFRRKIAILKRLDKLLKYKPYVDHPEAVKRLHLMRIAAKNLRYTLEIFRAFYGAGIEKAIRSSLAIQDVLGDLHEFDVCLDLVGKLAAERKNDKDFVKSITYLKSKIGSSRQQTYNKFVKIWERSEKEDTWGELKRAI